MLRCLGWICFVLFDLLCCCLMLVDAGWCWFILVYIFLFLFILLTVVLLYPLICCCHTPRYKSPQCKSFSRNLLPSLLVNIILCILYQIEVASIWCRHKYFLKEIACNVKDYQNIPQKITHTTIVPYLECFYKDRLLIRISDLDIVVVYDGVKETKLTIGEQLRLIAVVSSFLSSRLIERKHHFNCRV